MPSNTSNDELKPLAQEYQIEKAEGGLEMEESVDLPDEGCAPATASQLESSNEPKLFPDKVADFNKSVNDWVGCLTRIAFLLLGIGVAAKILIMLPASADPWIVRYPLSATLICLIVLTFVFIVSLSAQTFFTAMKYLPDAVSEKNILLPLTFIYYFSVSVMMLLIWWGAIHMTVFAWSADAMACMSSQSSTACATARDQFRSDLQKLDIW